MLIYLSAYRGMWGYMLFMKSFQSKIDIYLMNIEYILSCFFSFSSFSLDFQQVEANCWNSYLVQKNM